MTPASDGSSLSPPRTRSVELQPPRTKSMELQPTKTESVELQPSRAQSVEFQLPTARKIWPGHWTSRVYELCSLRKAVDGCITAFGEIERTRPLLDILDRYFPNRASYEAEQMVHGVEINRSLHRYRRAFQLRNWYPIRRFTEMTRRATEMRLAILVCMMLDDWSPSQENEFKALPVLRAQLNNWVDIAESRPFSEMFIGSIASAQEKWRAHFFPGRNATCKESHVRFKVDGMLALGGEVWVYGSLLD